MRANVHGFSPFQLAFGQNPKLPSAFTNKPPAHIQHDASTILTDNWTALRKARQAFILSESSERIWRALNNSVRPSGDTKYITRDFKKINEKRWRDPGKVLGQDGQQVLVKYGSNYAKGNPCQMSLARNASDNWNSNTVQKSVDSSQIRHIRRLNYPTE